MTSTEPVHALIRILNQLSFATDGFTADIDGMSDDELIYMPAIDHDILTALPELIRVIHPKERGKYKNAIVYLTALHEKQCEAWERFNEATAAEYEYIDNQIKALQLKINGNRNTANI